MSREVSRRQTWTAYILFGAIILVFVFFGFKTVEGPSAGYAAQVNREIISVSDFKRQFDQKLQFYSMMFGGQYNPTGPQLARLKNDVLEQLIGEKLVAQGAEQAGFRASDAQIRDQILSIPAFQKDGRFQRDRYEGYLTQVRSSAGQFEKELKDSVRVASLRTIMTDVLKPTSLELAKNQQLADVKVNTDYVEIDSNNALRMPPVSAAEIAAYSSQPDADKKLKDLYEQNKQRFETTEQVRASHILIRLDPTKPDSEKAALKKIEDIAQRAKTEDFATLASKLSEDPGSKALKGDLGFFGHGKMDPSFEKAAFELAPGTVSNPVKSTFGYHLIKVTGKKQAEKVPFEKAKMELAKEGAAEQKIQKSLTQIDEALKAQDSARVNQLVSSLGLKWETTGTFDLTTPSVPKVGPVEDFAKKAFELTPQKPLADHLVRFASKAYVIRYKVAGAGKTEKPKMPGAPDENMTDQLARGRLTEVLSSWEKTLLAKSKVNRNSMVLDQ